MTYRLGTSNVMKLIIRRINTVSGKVPTSILEILTSKPVGTKTAVKGWVKSVRKMKNYIFLDVNDGSCNSSLQVLFPKERYKESCQWGTSVNASGKLQENPNGQLELIAEEMEVVGKFDVKDDYPFTPKQKQSYDYYRQYLQFRPQIKYFTSMFRFRNLVSQTIHKYFQENGFIEIHTPIITSNDCEGGGEIFTVKPHSQKLIMDMKKKDVSAENAFFDSPAFLTVSGQLHLEVITRSILKVYTFNPTFRAENNKSRLHLSEFYMVEAEEAFVYDLENMLIRIEDFVKQIILDVLSKCVDDMKYMIKHSETDSDQHIKLLESILHKPFLVMSLSEAKSIINKNSDKKQLSEKTDPNNLSKEEELFLVESNNNVPVFVIDWPKCAKPFYMKECNENKNLVKGVDLLVPNVGELCGGSIREDNYDILKKKLIENDLLESLQWYLDLRKFSNVPTGGFGMGFERLLQFLLNVGNIKDTIPFPRWPHGLQL